MGVCNVTFKLKEVKLASTDIPEENCSPMLVSNKESKKLYVIIRHPSGVLFFDQTDGSITYCEELGWLKSNYDFVRFIKQSESVTFTGKSNS